MNKEEKFIEYLSNLKHDGNSELLENVISGFKTLVEYRVGGSISERQVDIMESEDEMLDDVLVDDSESFDEEMLGDLDTPLDESSSDVKSKIYGNNSDAARHAKYLDDQRAKMKEGLNRAGLNARASIEMMNRDNESVGKLSNVIGREGTNYSNKKDVVMEVGEGEIKGKLTPELYKQISKEADELERKLRHLAYKGSAKYSFKDDTERNKYVDDQIARFRGKQYSSAGIPEQDVKGLDPVIYEATDLLESVKRLNSLLHEALIEGIDAPKFNEDPIIPNALSLISSHSDAIAFKDKESFDSFLKKQKYFSASYSHCFYSVEELEDFRNRLTPVNNDCVILKDTGSLLVAVWDDVNGIGYIIPSNYNK